MKETSLVLMSRIKVYLLVVLMAFIMAALSSCGDDDDGASPQPDIVGFAQSDNNFTTLVTALTEANLVTALQGTGPFTVFAPTNAAFDAFIAGDPRYNTITELLADSDVLTAVLEYHVASGETFSNQLSDGTTITTLQGENIAVTENNGVVLNGNVRVTGADNDVSNGVVHIIDQVLLPPSLEPAEPQNIVQLAQANGLDTLLLALDAAGLRTTFEGEGDFTVFAPTDAAFTDFLAADGRFGSLAELVAAEDGSGNSVLEQVLQYHVLPTENFAADLANSEATLLQGQSITVEVDGNNVTLDGNTDVVTANVDASNGVVHVIDRVLIPEPLRIGNIVDIATAEVEGPDSQLDSLVAALRLFPDLLNDVLSDEEGTFTVFAPSNEAFRGLLNAVGQPSIGQLNEDVLRGVLEFHVVSTAGLRASQLQNNSNVETVAGEEVLINTGAAVTITTSANSAEVTTPDVAANNGVVHIIDAVLIPELAGNILGTVLQPVYFDADFSILTTALRQEELLEDLYNGSDLTFFAPDNAAFAAFLEDDSNNFNTQEDLLGFDGLEGVLRYHVLGARVLSSGLPGTGDDPQYEATLLTGPTAGTSVDLQIKEGGILTNRDVQIDLTRVDQETGNNSVIHVLEGVLLPPTIVDLAVGDGRFTELADALGTAGLVTTLSDTGPFTVFAPTDDAFGAAMTPTDPQELENVLRYHVTNGNVLEGNLDPNDNTVDTLLDDGGVQTFVLNGTSLTITGTSNSTPVNVIITDIQGTNGVIHVVDQVLLP